MQNYEIPRNYKGEGRILYIFSYKALIYTTVGIGIGVVFFILFKMLNLATVGVIITIILALIGFLIGTFKVPESNAFELTKKVGGENIDDVLIRLIKFKKNKKIYIYKEEETKDE